MSSGRRDVSLLRRALRYERDTGEVSSNVGMCACVRACVSWSTHPNLRKYPFFPSPSLFFDRYSVTGIGYRYLSLSLLRQTIQWMADRLKAHDRLTREAGKTYTVKICSFCQVPLLKRDDSVCYPFAQGS